jgi:hypothetical protein
LTNFDDWTPRRFANWLRKNHPAPESRYVEVTLNVHDGNGAIEKTTMSDDYETCIHELAFELALHHREKDVPQYFKENFPKSECTFLIQPAKRRKKKQMWLRLPPRDNPPESEL